MWTVTPHPKRGTAWVRRYALRWQGPASLPHLIDGWHMGAYRLKRDAMARAAALNVA